MIPEAQILLDANELRGVNLESANFLFSFKTDYESNI